MTRARFLALAVIVIMAGGALRTLWLRADPPTTSVGIVWHDEGAWVHNARNRALFDAWRTDNWNPVFIAPVFTAMEYAAFEAFGVGTWQARTVPVASGMAALAAIMAGLFAVAGARDSAAGRRTALMGGALLSVNYTWVMWNRAALMESTMTAFIVMAWAAYAMAGRRAAWGVLAGAAAVLAWFTKAAAAFFVAAIILDATWTIAVSRNSWLRDRFGQRRAVDVGADDAAGAWATLLGLAATAAVIAVAFVIPNWTEYRFYNWEMSVERKPAYDLRSFVDRASWLPIVQDFFTRMWLEVVAAALAVTTIAARWRSARPAERLLGLWLLVGFAELTVHDSGNERRYVMFIPALVGLAALFLGRVSWWPAHLPSVRWRSRVIALPLLLALGYLVFGSALAPALVVRDAVSPYATAVRVSAALAAALVLVVLALWPRLTAWLATWRLPSAAAVALVAVSLIWNVAQYVRWASVRGELNYQASVAVGALLPPETLVHGKLANGLALENRIRPIFVGRGFGNYVDRLSRDDARYILTVGLPTEGRESQPGLMQEILEHYPQRRVIATFTVEETPELDQAWLLDKFPGLAAAPPSGSRRAPD